MPGEELESTCEILLTDETDSDASISFLESVNCDKNKNLLSSRNRKVKSRFCMYDGIVSEKETTSHAEYELLSVPRKRLLLLDAERKNHRELRLMQRTLIMHRNVLQRQLKSRDPTNWTLFDESIKVAPAPLPLRHKAESAMPEVVAPEYRIVAGHRLRVRHDRPTSLFAIFDAKQQVNRYRRSDVEDHMSDLQSTSVGKSRFVFNDEENPVIEDSEMELPEIVINPQAGTNAVRSPLNDDNFIDDNDDYEPLGKRTARFITTNEKPQATKETAECDFLESDQDDVEKDDNYIPGGAKKLTRSTRGNKTGVIPRTSAARGRGRKRVIEKDSHSEQQSKMQKLSKAQCSRVVQPFQSSSSEDDLDISLLPTGGDPLHRERIMSTQQVGSKEDSSVFNSSDVSAPNSVSTQSHSVSDDTQTETTPLVTPKLSAYARAKRAGLCSASEAIKRAIQQYDKGEIQPEMFDDPVKQQSVHTESTTPELGKMKKLRMSTDLNDRKENLRQNLLEGVSKDTETDTDLNSDLTKPKTSSYRTELEGTMVVSIDENKITTQSRPKQARLRRPKGKIPNESVTKRNLLVPHNYSGNEFLPTLSSPSSALTRESWPRVSTDGIRKNNTGPVQKNNQTISSENSMDFSLDQSLSGVGRVLGNIIEASGEDTRFFVDTQNSTLIEDIPEQPDFPCPRCHKLFPAREIELHANLCYSQEDVGVGRRTRQQATEKPTRSPKRTGDKRRKGVVKDNKENAATGRQDIVVEIEEEERDLLPILGRPRRLRNNAANTGRKAATVKRPPPQERQETGECPICHKAIRHDLLQEHANTCLDNQG